MSAQESGLNHAAAQYPATYTKHDWNGVRITGLSWKTPAWKSNRRAFFMLTERKEAVYPWLYEDVGIRLDEAATHFLAAGALYEKAWGTDLQKPKAVEAHRDAVLELGQNCQGAGLHILQTLAAEDIRFVDHDPARLKAAISRLDNLLSRDLENEGNADSVRVELAAFRTDALKWLETHLTGTILFPAAQKD